MNLHLVAPDPIEIDPRPCELCGLTVDRHKMVDHGEGPEFFCDDIEREIYLRAAELVQQWEMDDPRDRWRHTGELPPTERVRNSDKLAKPADEPRPYRTPQATRDAFWYVVSLADPEKFKAWLADHPRDARFLIKLLEGK